MSEENSFKYGIKIEPFHKNYVISDPNGTEKYKSVRKAVDEDTVDEDPKLKAKTVRFTRMDSAPNSLLTREDANVLAATDEDGIIWEGNPRKVHRILELLSKDSFVTSAKVIGGVKLPSLEELNKKEKKEPEAKEPATPEKAAAKK